MHAEAVERVLALSLFEEFRHPVNALIDARLELSGDGAGATCSKNGAIAGTGSTYFCTFGLLQVVDATLEKGALVDWIVGVEWRIYLPSCRLRLEASSRTVPLYDHVSRLYEHGRKMPSHCSASLKPNIVTPSGNVDAAFKKALKTV